MEHQQQQPSLNDVVVQLTVLTKHVAELKGSSAGNTMVPRRPSPADVLKSSEVPDGQKSLITKPGNREQFKFCRSLQMLIQTTLEHFDEDGNVEQSAIPEIFEFLNTMSGVVSKRIKHIKLADRSEAGWSMVKMYEADPIAE